MNTSSAIRPSSGMVVGVLCLLGLAVTCAAKPPDVQTALDQWAAGQPGGLAAVWVDADGVAFFNAGHYSASDPRPITPDTQFEIGSITKVFTALLLADAVREGKVALDAPVGAPFAPGQITYLQLATHTSGLPRMPKGFTSADAANPYGDHDLPRLARAFADAAGAAKESPPSYSNFGFAVLGQAVAGAWQEPWGAALTRRVLHPLGLTDTVTDWRAADPKRLAPGHAASDPTPNWDLAAYAPAGGLVSTTRDFARFLQVCLGLVDTPLRAALADTVQPRTAGDTPARRQALAWILEKRDAATVVWHNGATGGYHSFVGYDAEKKVGVALLANQQRALESIGFALLAGRVPVTPAPTPAAPAADDLKEYLGNYPLTPSFIMAITAEGDRLFVQATSQPRLPLGRIATDRYAVGGVEAEVSFERDPAGKVAALVLHQNGAHQRAARLAPGEKPTLPKEVTLSPDELDAYVSTYAAGEFKIAVTRDGPQLSAQPSGQPKFPLFASAKDEFFLKAVFAQVSFTRDAAGKVVALTLHQNGRDLRAERTP